MAWDFWDGVYIAGFCAGSVIRKIHAAGASGQKAALGRENALDISLIALATAGFVVLPLVYLFSDWLAFASYALPSWCGWTGALIFGAALWLLWRSHADLGRNFSPMLRVREEHTLTTEGVYRWMRHPMYAAHWLWGLAQVLLLGNWIAGPAMLVAFLPLYLVRVPREEAMLADHFGEDYREYMERTGRVVPRFRE